MSQSDLARMLESFGLADQFTVHQADAMQLRCTDCREIVRAECVDLHDCGEPTPDYGEPDAPDRSLGSGWSL